MIRREVVRIMLEDHADFRLRVAAWMDREPDLEAVAQATSLRSEDERGAR